VLRRTVVGCVLLASCGSTADVTVLPAATSTTLPATQAPVVSTTTTATNTTTTTTVIGTDGSPADIAEPAPTQEDTAACSAVRVLALGNSTDMVPSYDGNLVSPEAWPALLSTALADVRPDIDVEVDNVSVPGAGFDISMFVGPTLHARLDELIGESAGDDRVTVLLVAPSIIDLQLRSFDVSASFSAFETLIAHADPIDHVFVLPMKPVASGLDERLSRAIEDFNGRLAGARYLEAAGPFSPLAPDGGRYGQIEYFDDFDNWQLDTAGPDPDLLHPDRDGHRAIADAIAPWLVRHLDTICAETVDV
jgi:hypothetical protein